MNLVNETWPVRHAGDNAACEPTAHELLNDAMQWLQYARGVTSLLADLIHEADAVDCKQVALSMEAIAAMTRLGTERVGQAHAEWHARSLSERARARCTNSGTSHEAIDIARICVGERLQLFSNRRHSMRADFYGGGKSGGAHAQG